MPEHESTGAMLDAHSTEVRRHLDETVRVWLGLPRDAPLAPPTLPDRLARRLLRLEEYENPRRDRWGRWEFDLSDDGFGDPRIPEIDRWVADRRAELGATADLEPLWPDGHRCAVCLTHDVDLISPKWTLRQIARHALAGLSRTHADHSRQGLLRFARPAVRVARSVRSGVARAPSTRDTLERSIEIEARRGLVASYMFTTAPTGGRSSYDCAYVPGDPCLFRGTRRRVAEVMALLAAEGFDIGLHGSYHAGARPGALAAERAALEQATGLDIRTTRQHLLHWDVRWTPRLQSEAGLRVDSSLGFNRTVGFRAGTSLPFRQFDLSAQEPLQLLQIPLVVQDVALVSPWGLGLDADRAFTIVEALLDSALDVGGAMTLVFHPDNLNDAGCLALYESTLDHALANDAWLTSLDGLATWWRAREASLLQA